MISLLILLNFTVDILEAERLPNPSSNIGTFIHAARVLIIASFTVEVFVSAFALSEGHFKLFYSNPWNLMDLIVVLVSLAVIYFDTHPQLKVLGLVRNFR